METISRLRSYWHIAVILLMGVFSFQISQSGIATFLLGFQESPPNYVWIFIALVYGLILGTIEFSPQLKPNSRTPKIILILVVLLTLIVVVFSVPFVFQPSPDTAGELRIVLELRASDSSGDIVDITEFDISCEPLYKVLRAGETAYTCTSDASSLVNSSVILQSFENDLHQTDVAGLDWKPTRRTSPEYTSTLTTDDMTSAFSIVAPDAGAYYYSLTVDQARIEKLVNQKSAKPLNVTVINAVTIRNSADSQRVYDERNLTGFRFQNLNFIVGLFAFISIWLTTINTIKNLNENSSDREKPRSTGISIVNKKQEQDSRESTTVNLDAPEKGGQPTREPPETSDSDMDMSNQDRADAEIDEESEE